MEYLLKTTLIGLFFGTFGTTLGGILGVTFKNTSNKFLSFILSLASRTNDFNSMFWFNTRGFRNIRDFTHITRYNIWSNMYDCMWYISSKKVY